MLLVLGADQAGLSLEIATQDRQKSSSRLAIAAARKKDWKRVDFTDNAVKQEVRPVSTSTALNPFIEEGSQRLLSRDEVEAVYGSKRRWLELAALDGTGPTMVKISSRLVRYRPGEIEAWIDARIVHSTSEISEASRSKGGRK